MTNKSIESLSADIYHTLDSAVDHEPDADLAAEYAMRIGGELAKATLPRNKPREIGKLWASDLGKPCMRQHWYKWNMSSVGDPLLGHTKFKFLYGNLLEEAVLYLAEEAGHTVTCQQERVETDVWLGDEHTVTEGWKISGRIDGLIDGVLMDVKSTSTYGFNKYKKEGLNASNDGFGYRWQLGFYNWFGIGDIALSPSQGFVWIDKQNGHIMYDEVDVPSDSEIMERANNIIEAVTTKNELDTVKEYELIPYGKSGNMELPLNCSYCDFKKQCWPGMRSFQYGHKPVHLGVVTREPKVPELT